MDCDWPERDGCAITEKVQEICGWPIVVIYSVEFALDSTDEDIKHIIRTLAHRAMDRVVERRMKEEEKSCIVFQAHYGSWRDLPRDFCNNPAAKKLARRVLELGWEGPLHGPCAMRYQDSVAFG